MDKGRNAAFRRQIRQLASQLDHIPPSHPVDAYQQIGFMGALAFVLNPEQNTKALAALYRKKWPTRPKAKEFTDWSTAMEGIGLSRDILPFTKPRQRRALARALGYQVHLTRSAHVVDVDHVEVTHYEGASYITTEYIRYSYEWEGNPITRYIISTYRAATHSRHVRQVAPFDTSVFSPLTKAEEKALDTMGHGPFSGERRQHPQRHSGYALITDGMYDLVELGDGGVLSNLPDLTAGGEAVIGLEYIESDTNIISMVTDFWISHITGKPRTPQILKELGTGLPYVAAASTQTLDVAALQRLREFIQAYTNN